MHFRFEDAICGSVLSLCLLWQWDDLQNKLLPLNATTAKLGLK